MFPGESWLIAGAALLVAEVVLPGVFLMWLGLAALGTGLLVLLLALVLAWQVVAFAVFAAMALGVAMRLRARRRATEVNMPGAGLVGRQARVLAGEGGMLRVRIGDSDWTARLASGAAMPAAGTILKVVDVEGTIVVVGA